MLSWIGSGSVAEYDDDVATRSHLPTRTLNETNLQLEQRHEEEFQNNLQTYFDDQQESHQDHEDEQVEEYVEKVASFSFRVSSSRPES